MDYSLCENLCSSNNELLSISTYCTLIYKTLVDNRCGIEKYTFVKYFNVPLLLCNKLYIAICGKDILTYEYFEYFVRDIFLQDMTELAKIVFAILVQEDEEEMSRSDIKLIFIHLFKNDEKILNKIIHNMMLQDENINYETFMFRIKKVNSDLFLIMINYIFLKLKALYLGYIFLKRSFGLDNINLYDTCNCDNDFKVMLPSREAKYYIQEQFTKITNSIDGDKYQRATICLSSVKIFTAILDELDSDIENE
jgi:hypothetical protein